MKRIGKILFITVILTGVLSIIGNFSRVYAVNLAEPCKVCQGTTCKTVASPPLCSGTLNECSTNQHCGAACTVADYCQQGKACRRKTDCSVSCSNCSYGCSGGECLPAPTPVQVCSPGSKSCSNFTLSVCNSLGTGWSTTTCAYGCNSSQDGCNTPTYCEDNCNGSCGSVACNNDAVKCWSSFADRSANKSPSSCSCVYKITCSTTNCPTGQTYLPLYGCCQNAYITAQGTCCAPTSTSCGGNASCTPPQVSTIDSCGGVNCGASCTGGGGGPGPGGGGACSSPTTPSPVSLIGGAQSGSTTTLTWTGTTDWGAEVSATNPRTYTVCSGTSQTNPCASGSYTASLTPVSPSTVPPLSTAYTTAPSGTNYWQVRAINTCGSASAWSSVNSFCKEGFDGTSPTYISAWSACDGTTHKRTRTCTEDCGTDNCTAFAASNSLTQDCTGSVRGTIFDASDYSSCPAFDPATGYLIGIPQSLAAVNHSFGFSDQNTVAPHPFAPLTTPITTNANGNYSISVYSPATYIYNFSSLSDIFITAGGPKLTCTAASAIVTGSPPACTTQPCTTLNNMSFGFWKKYGGWWQAVGGSVYAQTGIKSVIPKSLPAAEQVLIKQDTVNGNRLGVLTYGVTRPSDIYGAGNVNAKASSSLWEKESRYEGPIYDWNYFHTRFNRFAVTAWDGGAISYDDEGRGWQIFRYTGDISNFSINPSGTQKLIFDIEGDVTITGDITVPSGAFLAIISSGTITFDPAVSRADGWFVADNLSIPCRDIDSNGCDRNDSQFLGNGSFIGWYSVTLSRDRDAVNNTAPSELFSYREDLYTNAPEPLRVYAQIYKPFVP